MEFRPPEARLRAVAWLEQREAPSGHLMRAGRSQRRKASEARTGKLPPLASSAFYWRGHVFQELALEVFARLKRTFTLSLVQKK